MQMILIVTKLIHTIREEAKGCTSEGMEQKGYDCVKIIFEGIAGQIILYGCLAWVSNARS